MKEDSSSRFDKKNGAERHLIFSLGTEEYAVPILKVKEVIEIPDITPIPHTPRHYMGIMNLRGLVISIIDLRLKVKGIAQEIGKKNAVIILDFGSFCFGVAVSSVNRVIPIEHDEVKERPPMESMESLEYIQGVVYRDKRLILILDVSKALNIDDMQAIKHPPSNIKIA
jgi:purine-binding chemotaxis protein CheW